MSTPAPIQRLSPEAYLAWEDDQPSVIAAIDFACDQQRIFAAVD